MENSKLENKKPKFVCPYCGKKLKTISFLKAHITEKHLLYVYYCPYCNEKFETFRKFQYHLRMNIDDYHQNLFHLVTRRHIRFVNKNLFLSD